MMAVAGGILIAVLLLALFAGGLIAFLVGVEDEDGFLKGVGAAFMLVGALGAALVI